MPGFKQDTKLMAKNSAFMYIQMAVKMLIGLYTVRVILHALGEEDYGIYNVVGGFVSMFTFITSTLVSASMRFFAYAIGKKEYGLLNRYFNTTIICYLLLSALLFVTIEIIGYWFVNNKMVLSPNRLSAANWVLQFAIFSFIVRILAVPFKSMIVAYEKMVVFAIISVFDSFLLLGIAFFVQLVTFDKLKFYAICIFCVALISTILYVIWCRSSFRDASQIRLRWEKPLLKEILGYSGWYMFGTMATVVRSQGLNILLNVFFNPVVNAARAIAYQINNAINQFVNSFYNAVRPQITKMTASEEYEKMLSLVYSSSVISYLLMCLVAIPLLVEMPFVLSVWLGDVPEYTVVFSRLVIITAMVDTLGYPLTTAVCASGEIRNFQIVTGLILMAILPVSYFLLKVWPHPTIVFYTSILLSLAAQVVRLGYMQRMFCLQAKDYIKKVLLRITVVTALSLMISLCIECLLARGGWGHFTTITISFIVVSLLSWFIGMSSSQRAMIVGLVRKRLSK